MSEVLAQLYDGNPMSITEEELTRLYRGTTFGMGLEMEQTRPGKAGKGWSKPGLYRVFRPAMRAEGERTLAENVTRDVALLIVDGAKYLHLLPAAVRELRQRPGLIEKNQLAMRADPE